MMGGDDLPAYAVWPWRFGWSSAYSSVLVISGGRCDLRIVDTHMRTI